MLHGFLIFNSSSGVLLFQKKFSKGFGLAAAANNPSAADPVSLALQLFAFQKFSGNLENELLEFIALGSGGESGVHLVHHGQSGSKAESVSESNEVNSGNARPVTLALFSSFPIQLSRHLANGILQTFVAQFSTVLQAAPAHSAPALGKFESLDGFLQEVPDALVSNVTQRIPFAIEWLLVIWGDTKIESATAAPQVNETKEEAPKKSSSSLVVATSSSRRRSSSGYCCNRTSSSPDPAFDGVVATSGAPGSAQRSSSAPTKRSRSGSRGCLPRWSYWRKRERIVPDSEMTEPEPAETCTAKPPTERSSLSPLSCCYLSSASNSSSRSVAPQFIEKLVGEAQKVVGCKDTAQLNWSPEEGMSRTQVAVLAVGSRLTLLMPLPMAAVAPKLEPLRDSLRSDLLSLCGYLSFLSDAPRTRTRAERPPRMPAAHPGVR